MNPNSVQFDKIYKSICLRVRKCSEELYKYIINYKRLKQWFLTLLEVLNPTSSIHAFIEPFVDGKIKCVS